MNIPLYKPYINKKEISAVLRVLKSNKLSKGQEVENFEKEFAKYTNKKYAVAVNSGTSGLHLLVRAMGWKRGDEIITTPFTYIASSNALLFEGVKPIFVDINIKTLNIDPEKVGDKISKKVRGMLLVDILGLPVDYEKLVKIKEEYNLQVIEDACEALGRPNDNFTVGKLADATVYGFHENKQLTTAGEGGMIVTDNLKIAESCFAMRDQGRSLKKDWINNVILGFNFRMTEVQAAFGREQLKKMDRILKRRELIAEKYSTGFRGIEKLSVPNQESFNKRSWFLYFIVLENSEIRDKIHKALLDSGITSSKNYFPPIYDFPMYKDHKKDCKNTEIISETLLALPMFYEMDDKQVNAVVDVIKKTLKKIYVSI
jgi:perosamine synthetase